MIELKIIDTQNNSKIISVNSGIILYEAFATVGIIFNANCSGKGICGACKVYIEEEKEFILACKYVVTTDIHVRVNFLLSKENKTANYNEDSTLVGMKFPQSTKKNQDNSNAFYGISIDIGTTTIGMALIYIPQGEILNTYGVYNSQRVFGADVASRIFYADSKDKLNELKKYVWKDILTGIRTLIEYQEKWDMNKTLSIVINGNTTMLNILKGYDVSGIGRYPFTAVDLLGGESYIYEFNLETDFIYEYINKDLYDYVKNAVVKILPSSSAYIGSDVISGAAYLKIGQTEDYEMLIDLGTNGEIIIANNKIGVSGSTACGPAFEQALKGHQTYGSNLIDRIIDAYDRRLINQEGMIIKRFFDKGIPCDGGVILTQKTIRDIQLAKAAIYAGIIILTRHLNIDISDIKKVYIAGGFGAHLNIEHGARLGMLPKELLGRYEIVGNTSLKSGVEYLINPSIQNVIEEFILKLENVDLATKEDFNKVYLNSIKFD